MADFVNPYTFVGFSPEVSRGEPNGHEAMGEDHLSGSLKVRVTARTPLLLGGYGTSESPDVPRRHDGTAMIPGSSLLGAVRSLHEAIVGGCLRVMDAEYVPVHRHPAHIDFTRDLSLAVVTDEGDGAGRMPRVELCDDFVWVDKDLLGPKPPSRRLPATGDRLTLPVAEVETINGRRVLRATEVKATDVDVRSASSAQRGPWVLLVTDTRARSQEPAYFVAGRLGQDVRPVTAQAWATYLQCVEGTEDVRLRREQRRASHGRDSGVGGPSDETFDEQLQDVLWPPPRERDSGGPPVARRLAARPYLRKGQPVWVRVTDDAVTEIRLSQLWRRRGAYPVADRVGKASPCSDPTKLCWSCRVFGSANVDGRLDDAAATQDSYRGHVRIEDAAAAGPCSTLDWKLAPLLSPRPSAGQFYLEARKVTLPPTSEPAAATWGSVADRSTPRRQVRGRKFYWRTADPTGGDHPRGRRREHHTDGTTRSVPLVQAGAMFETRVAFDNLSRADLGSLVVALDPCRLWPETAPDEEIVTSVGGGKPFGFGAIAVDIELERADTAAVRYLGQSTGTASDLERLVGEAVSACQGQVPQPVRRAWAGLRHALTLGFVADEKVWYPPGDGAKGSPEYDRGFTFWKESSGVELDDETRPLTGLPDPAGEKQVLPSKPARRKPAPR